MGNMIQIIEALREEFKIYNITNEVRLCVEINGDVEIHLLQNDLSDDDCWRYGTIKLTHIKYNDYEVCLNNKPFVVLKDLDMFGSGFITLLAILYGLYVRETNIGDTTDIDFKGFVDTYRVDLEEHWVYTFITNKSTILPPLERR